MPANAGVASVTVGYAPSGKRIVKRGRGRTKTEAQRKLREIIRDYEDGQTTKWWEATTL